MRKTVLTALLMLIVGIASGACMSAEEFGKPPYHVKTIKVDKPKKQMKCKRCTAFRESKACKRSKRAKR